MTKDEIMTAIDNMPIYREDFDIIENLLDTASDSLISTITEEVLNGELYWSDFERFLDNSYGDTIKKVLANQQDIKGHYNLYRSLYRLEHNGVEPDENSITVRTNTGKENQDKAADAEVNRVRDNILYLLSLPSQNDTVLSRAMKRSLYNNIRNGKILIRKKDNTGISYDEGKITVTKADENNVKTTESYQYIDPKDIFLFLNNYYIPIDYEHQVLDEIDLQYMKTHNIDVGTMKKMKALASQYRLLNNEQGL